MSQSRAAAVERLRAVVQSVWIDDLTRQMIAGGQLAELLAQGVTGITANPTTFDKAVTESDLYDADIRRLGADRPADEVLRDLLVEDVRNAAAALGPVHEQTGGADGYVSIEVAPDLAYDTDRTVAAARVLWARCDRPNVLVKVPATAEGLPAIRRLLSEGVNVNVTLTFSLRRYEEVVEAFLSGLESRLERGLPIDRVASVASFFVSRVDSKVDPELRRRLAEAPPGEARDGLAGMLGTTAIANSKLAYQRFRELHSGPRWERLANAGARPQRCLWASTSVKEEAYRPTMYVEALAGPDTVDTMPLKTFDALAEARIEGPELERDVDLARERIARLADFGIDLDRVTAELESEGVRSFADSYHHLVGVIEKKVSPRGRDRCGGERPFPTGDAHGARGEEAGEPTHPHPSRRA
jgi:transaldolase